MAPVNIFITIDTEHSIGGAFADSALKPVGNEKRIFGFWKGKAYGIPLQMDIAERFGLRLTFFVEVLNHLFFGKDETRRVVEAILSRGHDVQLHLHPNYLNFTLPDCRALTYSDLMKDYPLERQIDMIGEARRDLVSYGVPSPIAFRAGCYGANPDTLRALSANGFLIDSSYNQAYLGNPCLFPDWKLNDISEKEGIYEFPLTNFVEETGVRAKRFMPLDINGVSFEEMRHVLNEAAAGRGPKNITVILHSFSFLSPRDVQYSKVRIRRHVIRRFEKLCRFLAENSQLFHVTPFGDLTPLQLEMMSKDAVNVMPKVPARLSVMRFGGQLMDRLC